jgi:hypothetical protein
MSDQKTGYTSKTQLTRIDDLSEVGHELSEEHLRLASGGLRFATYVAACCTVGGDTDWRRCD